MSQNRSGGSKLSSYCPGRSAMRVLAARAASGVRALFARLHRPSPAGTKQGQAHGVVVAVVEGEPGDGSIDTDHPGAQQRALAEASGGGDEGHLVAGRRSGIQRVDQARAWHKPGRNRGDVEFALQEPEVLIAAGGGRGQMLSPWWASRRLGLRGEDARILLWLAREVKRAGGFRILDAMGCAFAERARPVTVLVSFSSSVYNGRGLASSFCPASITQK